MITSGNGILKFTVLSELVPLFFDQEASGLTCVEYNKTMNFLRNHKDYIFDVDFSQGDNPGFCEVTKVWGTVTEIKAVKFNN